MTATPRATIDDLYHIPENGKAELVNGEIVFMNATGFRPGRASGKIFMSLGNYEDEHGGGYAVPDNVGFIVHLPARDSFSPNAAWFIGEVNDDDLRFVEGAPAFAVEVRSEDDYGPAERAILAKIADYFAAGTEVVWEVDLRSGDVVIRAYHTTDPITPIMYRRGDIAHAEPAVPGWTFPVNRLFARGLGRDE